jgi:hypothetical protein
MFTGFHPVEDARGKYLIAKHKSISGDAIDTAAVRVSVEDTRWQCHCVRPTSARIGFGIAGAFAARGHNEQPVLLCGEA